MVIDIITCHDVYNAGAGLQAYALLKYLTDEEHDVKIIDYKPDYLSRHYSLTDVSNPLYDKPFIRVAYLVAKLPGRLKRRKQRKKLEFDNFRKQYLILTEETYRSYGELLQNCPVADLYLAGSDQIWNPQFRNGHDSAFYLMFTKDRNKKASYAASFSVDELSKKEMEEIGPRLRELGFISVREKCSVDLLKQMGLQAVQVCDPVVLPDTGFWTGFSDSVEKIMEEPYCFLYDFDNTPFADILAGILKEKSGYRIVSYFGREGADQCCECGPVHFVSLIRDASFIISNSYHATLFAMLFHKNFAVISRKENLNSRMRDLLQRTGLADRMVDTTEQFMELGDVDWAEVDAILERERNFSRQYLRNVIRHAEENRS